MMRQWTSIDCCVFQCYCSSRLSGDLKHSLHMDSRLPILEDAPRVSEGGDA